MRPSVIRCRWLLRQPDEATFEIRTGTSIDHWNGTSPGTFDGDVLTRRISLIAKKITGPNVAQLLENRLPPVMAQLRVTGGENKPDSTSPGLLVEADFTGTDRRNCQDAGDDEKDAPRLGHHAGDAGDEQHAVDVSAVEFVTGRGQDGASLVVLVIVIGQSLVHALHADRNGHVGQFMGDGAEQNSFLLNAVPDPLDDVLRAANTT